MAIHILNLLKDIFYENDYYINNKLNFITVHSKWTYTKIGTIQRRLAWPLRKDDTQIREAFQIFCHFFYNFS